MSQYCRPEAVFMPSPATLVGALVFGTGLWAGVWAKTTRAVKTTAANLPIPFTALSLSTPNYCRRDAKDAKAFDNPKCRCYPRKNSQILRVFCVLRGFHFHSSAITSISTSTSFGRRATSTVERAGGAVLKYLP